MGVCDYADKIEKYANKYGIPLEYAAALVMQESSGNPMAERFEEPFYKKYIENKPIERKLSSYGWTKKEMSSSHGLTQVMGIVAYNETGDPHINKKLKDPDTNLDIGFRIYGRYYKKYKDPRVAYMAYNGGEGAARQYLRTGRANDMVMYNSSKFMEKVEKIRQNPCPQWKNKDLKSGLPHEQYSPPPIKSEIGGGAQIAASVNTGNLPSCCRIRIDG